MVRQGLGFVGTAGRAGVWTAGRQRSATRTDCVVSNPNPE